MIDENIIPVNYISQPDEQTCWYASYKMMLDYQSMGAWNARADHLPNMSLMRERGILDSELAPCRNHLGLSSTTYKSFLTAGGVADAIDRYGPVWCSGFWAEGHKHIVVLCGVREGYISAPEVYVNDPRRALHGAASKGTWWSFEKFVKNLNKVPYAFQHWA
ncbi:MAG: papain-like cysteine protease family protein [Bryobacteraceae bacterium]